MHVNVSNAAVSNGIMLARFALVQAPKLCALLVVASFASFFVAVQPKSWYQDENAMLTGAFSVKIYILLFRTHAANIRS